MLPACDKMPWAVPLPAKLPPWPLVARLTAFRPLPLAPEPETQLRPLPVEAPVTLRPSALLATVLVPPPVNVTPTAAPLVLAAPAPPRALRASAATPPPVVEAAPPVRSRAGFAGVAPDAAVPVRVVVAAALAPRIHSPPAAPAAAAGMPAKPALFGSPTVYTSPTGSMPVPVPSQASGPCVPVSVLSRVNL